MSASTEQAKPSVHALAARQHGLISRVQLIQAGMSRGAIRWEVQSERLVPVQRGVYRVGPLVAPLAREMAAVLASGPGAVVSHRSAAVLWGLGRLDDAATVVEITVPGADRGRRAGIRAHRVRYLASVDVSVLDGIPITTPARTILDLAGRTEPAELERLLAHAFRRALASVTELRDLVARYPKRRGVGCLRALLDADDAAALTRSEAEQRLLDLVRKAQLPAPRTNVLIGGMEVDFAWTAYHLIVEVDGFAFHSSRSSFENDRRRDAKLTGRGFRVMRVTWRQLVQEPEAVLVNLTLALSAGNLDDPRSQAGERVP